MTRTINQNGLDLIKQWEGLRLEAYQDIAQIWTIGYGHTKFAGAPIPIKNMKISLEKAEKILKNDLHQYEQAVEKTIKITLNDNQFATLVSLCFNIGIGAFQKSTLVKKLNKGDYDCVPSELMKWIYASGKKVQGLSNRRRAEGALWIKGAYISSNYIIPENSKQKNVLKPEIIGPVLGAASGLTSIATGNGPFQWALAGLIIAGATIGLVYFYKHMKEQEL